MNIPDNAVVVFTGEQLRAFVNQITESPERKPTYTLQEAADRLGVSIDTMYRRRKEIGAYQLTPGGKWLVDGRSITAYKERCKGRR